MINDTTGLILPGEPGGFVKDLANHFKAESVGNITLGEFGVLTIRTGIFTYSRADEQEPPKH